MITQVKKDGYSHTVQFVPMRDPDLAHAYALIELDPNTMGWQRVYVARRYGFEILGVDRT